MDDTAGISEQPHQNALKLVEELSNLVNGPNDKGQVIAVLDELAITLRDDLPRLLGELTKGDDLEVLRQLGRVAANLVIDCDENRKRLVDAGYIDAILSTTIFNSNPSQERAPAILAITASLHNLTVEKHASVVSSLKQELHLRSLLDFTRLWSKDFYSVSPLDETTTIFRWSWSILSILLEEPPSLDRSALDTLLLPFHSTSTSSDVDARLHILTCSSSILEACLAVEGPLQQDIQPQLEVLIDFVEKAEIPIAEEQEESDEGDEDDEEESEDHEKTMGKAKAAIVRVLVDLSSEMPSSSTFWTRMRSWLGFEDRLDLVNCALLSFGNSIKDSVSAQSLVSGDSSLLPVVLPLLSSSTPATTQHSVIGLVRNISVPVENQVILGDAEVVDKIMKMNVWAEEKDLLGSVQGGAATILKNLCRNNVVNTQRLLTHPLHPLLDLIKRADDPALRFECTRVFVNVIKSLSMAQQSVSPVADPRVIAALTKMLIDGAQYPILQSESVIALTLLATFGGSKIKSTISSSLEGSGMEIVQRMTEDSRREIKENANTLLKAINQ